MAEDSGSLFHNKLLWQLLSGGGAAMAQGKPIAPAINDITQNAISSGNYAALLQQILGGGGQLTLNKDKFSLTGQPSLLGPQGSGVSAAGGVGAQGGQYQGPGPHAGMTQAPQGQGGAQPNQLGMEFIQRLLNPQ